MIKEELIERQYELFDKVLERLYAHGLKDDDLPVNEIFSIAGGAIGNIIGHMYNENHPELINDIDIWILEEAAPDNFNESIYTGSTYAHFKIKSSTKIENINYINIVPKEYLMDRNSFAYFLIGEFDINCVQVGMDFKNKCIFFTQEFCNFIETQKIQATYIGNYANTILRIIDKCTTLGLTENLHEELLFLITLGHYDNNFFIKHGNYISEEKYENKYTPNKEIIDKYFWVILNTKDSYSLIPKYKIKDLQERELSFVGRNKALMLEARKYFDVIKDRVYTDE